MGRGEVRSSRVKKVQKGDGVHVTKIMVGRSLCCAATKQLAGEKDGIFKWSEV